MSKEEVKCPVCGAFNEQSSYKCLACGTILDSTKIPAKENTQERSKTKNCPYCKEEIQYEAIKCRFCGEYLTQEAKKEAREEITKTKKESRGGLITFLILLAIAALIALLTGL